MYVCIYIYSYIVIYIYTTGQNGIYCWKWIWLIGIGNPIISRLHWFQWNDFPIPFRAPDSWWFVAIYFTEIWGSSSPGRYPSGNDLHSYGLYHHVQWENSLFLWWFSITMLNCQRAITVDDTVNAHTWGQSGNMRGTLVLTVQS